MYVRYPCALQRWLGCWFLWDVLQCVCGQEEGLYLLCKGEGQGTMWHLFLDWVLVREGGDSFSQGRWVWNENQGMIQLWHRLHLSWLVTYSEEECLIGILK